MKKRKLDQRRDFMLAELRGVVESYVPIGPPVDDGVRNDMLWALSVALRNVVSHDHPDDWDRRICEIDERLRDLFHSNL